ncbi:H-NS family protein MvaT [Halopseudomonas litoralis]|uniref:H-NS family protein MvaT n=1 Tax=Halopseudomonas litoralis TaxID=797277 RepID=A0A1H1Q356_9GAMM|nr:histone-like nucleoid-structuring protein, MvaT/MvaU family [Halopseudomonas litoralis]SDS17697.1 H-NS family protein MvaT [Halopseudomonas litoralis]
MSKLAEFRHIERQLAAQLAELEALKDDKGLQREIEFETKLHELLAEYTFSAQETIRLLDGQPSKQTSVAVPVKAASRVRRVKTYTNPHNGQVVQTKGGNHNVLKEWKAEYGAATVESWVS